MFIDLSEHPGRTLDEEWADRILAMWKAEKESRPSKKEKELWPRTIVDLEFRLKVVEDPEIRSDLYHRLVMAEIKLEDYSTALEWAEKGLSMATSEWNERLLEDKAQALFLAGREAEAISILEDIAPLKGPEIPTDIIGVTVHVPADDVTFDLLCPECFNHVSYGLTRCPICGTKVDPRFQLIRSTCKGGKVTMTPEDTGPVHRMKEFRFLFTTFTVDHDDPENFLTAHRMRLMGQEIITHTSKEWYAFMGLVALIIINVLFGLLILSVYTSGQGGSDLALIYAVIWAFFSIPSLLFYLWVLLPPSGTLSECSGP